MMYLTLFIKNKAYFTVIKDIFNLFGGKNKNVVQIYYKLILLYWTNLPYQCLLQQWHNSKFWRFELSTSSKSPETTVQVVGNCELSMHCLQINKIKYIYLSSVITRKITFQKLLLINNWFWVMSLLKQTHHI